MNKRPIAAPIVLLATVLFSLAPLVRGGVELPVAEHHLLHAVMLAGAALAGILFVGSPTRVRPGSPAWLLVAMLAPLPAMLLMWPSDYAYLETHAFGHVVEHLGLVGLGFVTGYAGQRYANGIGWAAGLSIVAMAALAAGGYGVGPVGASVAQTAPQAAVPSTTAAAFGAPHIANGAKLFSQNCAVCHGVAGAGGEGPSLRGESARKSLVLAENWIANPAPPMPKLYPSTLSAQDVADVAGYVETLK